MPEVAVERASEQLAQWFYMAFEAMSQSSWGWILQQCTEQHADWRRGSSACRNAQ